LALSSVFCQPDTLGFREEEEEEKPRRFSMVSVYSASLQKPRLAQSTMNRFNTGNILGDPFALATISISIVRDESLFLCRNSLYRVSADL
jgi:hypothetical protein